MRLVLHRNRIIVALPETLNRFVVNPYDIR